MPSSACGSSRRRCHSGTGVVCGSARPDCVLAAGAGCVVGRQARAQLSDPLLCVGTEQPSGRYPGVQLRRQRHSACITCRDQRQPGALDGFSAPPRRLTGENTKPPRNGRTASQRSSTSAAAPVADSRGVRHRHRRRLRGRRAAGDASASTGTTASVKDSSRHPHARERRTRARRSNVCRRIRACAAGPWQERDRGGTTLSRASAMSSGCVLQFAAGDLSAALT
jgi:hypothetical protein